MGPGNDSLAFEFAGIAPWPRCGAETNATVPVRALEFARANATDFQARNGTDYLAKRPWDRTKDEETTRCHATRQNFEKKHLEASQNRTRRLLMPMLQARSRQLLGSAPHYHKPHSTRNAKSWEAKFIKNRSAENLDCFFALCRRRLEVAGGLDLQGHRPRIDVVTKTR